MSDAQSKPKVLATLREGLALVRGASRYLLLAYVGSFVLALPLAAAMKRSIARSVGRSEVGARIREGFDGLWYQGFMAKADGLAASFDSSVVGIGSVFNALNGLVTGKPLDVHVLIVAVSLAYLALWVFLGAGLVARFAAVRSNGFFADAVRHFPRFVALAGVAGVMYWLILGPLRSGLGELVEQINHETIDERVHFAWVLGKYAVVWSLVWVVALVFDYAKIASVLREGESLPMNLRRALGLVVGNKKRTVGLSAALLSEFVLLTVVYWAVAPGAGYGSWAAIVGVFVLGQGYLVGRIALRGWFYASQTVMARGLLGS
jgi:hypothetical protein